MHSPEGITAVALVGITLVLSIVGGFLQHRHRGLAQTLTVGALLSLGAAFWLALLA
jgi:hypothetical protein